MRRRARCGRRAPGSQAGEPLPRERAGRRRDQAPRLRDLEALGPERHGRSPAHRGRRSHRLAALHAARAAPRSRRRRPRRHLGARCLALRARHGPPPVSGGEHDGRVQPHPPRRSGAAVAPARRRAPRARRGGAPLPREGSEESLRVGERSRGRARAVRAQVEVLAEARIGSGRRGRARGRRRADGGRSASTRSARAPSALRHRTPRRCRPRKAAPRRSASEGLAS